MTQSARYQDDNGFLLVKGCPVASFGIFQYSAAQLGMDGDQNRIVNVYRPESEVSNADYLASFQIVPMINDHEMLSGFQDDSTTAAPEEKGVDGVLVNVGYASPWVLGDLKIFARSTQADLSSGKKDLSLGYTCDFDLKTGVYDGQKYEAVQTNMRGNHIALVDVGRVPGARVLDGRKICFDHLDISFTTDGATMAKPRRKALDSDVVAQLQAQLKALLPTFEQFLSEEATEPAHAGAMAGGTEGAAPAGATQPAAAPAQAGAAEPAPAAAPTATAAAEPEMAGGATGTGEVAAQAVPGAAAPAEGEEDNGGSEGGAAALIDQMMATLAQLKQQLGGAEPAAAAPAAQSAPAEGAAAEGGESASESTSEGEETGDDMGGASGMEEGAEGAEEAAGDTVEGLEGTTREGTDEGGESIAANGQGKASPGPAAGKHTGADAALRSFYADNAVKTRLHGRLSSLVGAFDGAVDIASATAADVAAYGVKKLGLKCQKGHEVSALDAYLEGVEKGRVAKVQKQASDAAAADDVPAIDAYFKEQ